MALVSGFDDLEDAMQYYSAISSKVDVVLTRNKKDFVEANVPVMTPDEFLLMDNKTRKNNIVLH